jgi:ubiquinone/menaquinone biosynthesis C-methylase UbiE
MATARAGNVDYVVKVGKDADHRLKILHQIFREPTMSFYKRLGLEPGMHVLEVGCGTGYTAIDIARMVGKTGKVTAIDISPEQLDVARANAAAAGVTNIEFVHIPAEEVHTLPVKFDFVVCRFILMHVKDPTAVLRAMYAALKPSGIIACEEPSMAACFSSVKSAAFDLAMAWHLEYSRRAGLDFDIGVKLYFMVKTLGCLEANVQLAQPIVKDNEPEKDIYTLLTAECKPRYIEKGVATAEEVDRVVAELDSLTKDPMVFFGCARQFQVSGKKPAADSTATAAPY